jgi:hypothetical protein
MVSIFLNDNKARDGDLEWVVRGCTKIAEQEQANDLLFLPPPPPQHGGGAERLPWDPRSQPVSCPLPARPGQTEPPTPRALPPNFSLHLCMRRHIYIYI